MKEIHKESGVPTFAELRLNESVHLQLDTGRLDRWLAENRKAAESFDPVAVPLLRKLNWQERLQRTDRPWIRRLMRHRERRR